MSFGRKVLLAALVSLALPLSTVQAGVRVAVGVGWPFYRPYYYRPVYVAPGPVYVAPVPVYVVPAQAPVYVQAPPQVIAAPSTPTTIAVPPPPAHTP